MLSIRGICIVGGLVLGFILARTGGLIGGALLGYGLGYLLEKFWPQRSRSTSFQQMNLPAAERPAFLLCTFSLLGKLALQDGKVTEDEVKKVEFIDHHLLLDKKHRALALKLFHEALNSPLDHRDYAERFSRSFPNQIQLLIKMVEILLRVSTADTRLSPTEDELIRSTALLLGLTEPHYEELKASCCGGLQQGSSLRTTRNTVPYAIHERLHS